MRMIWREGCGCFMMMMMMFNDGNDDKFCYEDMGHDVFFFGFTEYLS